MNIDLETFYLAVVVDTDIFVDTRVSACLLACCDYVVIECLPCFLITARSKLPKVLFLARCL